MGRFQPALLGGLFIGVLSSLPYVSSANICCCLWVITGGLLTVYMQQQARPDPIETGEAVLGGLVAGLIGAVIAWGAVALMVNFTDPIWQEQFRESLEGNPAISPEMRDRVLQFMTGPSIAMLIGAIYLPTFAVFAMLGALLGVAFFRKKVPPQAPPPPVQM
jgi:hypothetical protein